MFTFVRKLQEKWNHFFFARTHVNIGTMMGYLRIAYAICLLYDRFILWFDCHTFFISQMIPCQQYFHPMSIVADSSSNPHSHSSHYIDTSYPNSPMCTIASYLPPAYHSIVVWTFFYMGVCHMILLLCGILPKLQIIALQCNYVSFHYYTPLLWDGEDSMIKMWNFLFLFLPLHHVTIYDMFCSRTRRGRSIATTVTTVPTDLIKDNLNVTTTTTKEDTNTNGSWPMWPFRLFQLELCCIYFGAGYGKLSAPVWRSGNALYHVRLRWMLLLVGETWLCWMDNHSFI
jgi:hypothetical protein